MSPTPTDHPGQAAKEPQSALRPACEPSIEARPAQGTEQRRVHRRDILAYIAEHSAWTEREHLMWLGPRNRRGGPYAVVPLTDGTVMPVRRYLNGHRKRDGYHMTISRACPARPCINPAHASYHYEPSGRTPSPDNAP